MGMTTFNDVIVFAIRREEEAAKVYGEMMAMAKEESARKLLLDLQEEERNHKRVLQGLTEARTTLASGKDVRDLKISDYLVDEPLEPAMNFQDLLIFAAKREKKAVDLYKDLAKEAETKELKRLFEYLEKQEKAHKLRLELEYEKRVLWED
jgi:rubrerythrin